MNRFNEAIEYMKFRGKIHSSVKKMTRKMLKITIDECQKELNKRLVNADL